MAFGDSSVFTRQRAKGKGKADIGGRLRVATILRRAGVASSAPPERIAGSTNEVWRAGDLVVRVGFVEGATRLQREAALSRHLPWDVRYPPVFASGTESFGEWIIVRNRPGAPLSEAWHELDRAGRRRAVHELGHAIKALHQTELGHGLDESLAFDPNSLDDLPHQLPVSKLFALIDEARTHPWADQGLLSEVEAKIAQCSDAFGSELPSGLVHGDLHFENALVRNGSLVSLLDFEWCRPGHKEIDLDVLARFCAHPDLTVADASKADRDSYRPVLAWLNEVYPELFAAPNLAKRLMLCALAFEIPWLVKMPPNAASGALPAYHPVNRLRDLLDQGTEAERLGWVATGV
jgi:aminoglycoside phosphotransferase (APT) family kinase protein